MQTSANGHLWIWLICTLLASGMWCDDAISMAGWANTTSLLTPLGQQLLNLTHMCNVCGVRMAIYQYLGPNCLATRRASNTGSTRQRWRGVGVLNNPIDMLCLYGMSLISVLNTPQPPALIIPSPLLPTSHIVVQTTAYFKGMVRRTNNQIIPFQCWWFRSYVSQSVEQLTNNSALHVQNSKDRTLLQQRWWQPGLTGRQAS